MNTYDINLWRGNSYQVVAFSFPFDITGSEFRLTIDWSGGGMTYSTAPGAEHPLTITTMMVGGVSKEVVSFVPTILDTRTIGARANYELERIIGSEQRTYVRGRVIMQGGVNLD